MDTQAKVDAKHPTYEANQVKRNLFDAVMNGTDGVRAGKETYLPKYPEEAPSDYEKRLGMSTIDGDVAQGVDGFCGKVFHEPVNTDKVVPQIKPLLENIDLQGNKFDVFGRQMFKYAFDGFSLILTDAPKANGEVRSLEDERMQGIRPYMRGYRAKDVFNPIWITDPATNTPRLARITLYEATEEPDGDFGIKKIERIRCYFHWVGQPVQVEVWRKKEKADNTGEQWFIEEARKPLEKLTKIPASFIGKFEFEPWLMNESRLEIKAYQKESSYDTIEYMGLPSFYTKGWEPGDNAKAAIGASVHWRLPVDGDIGFAQIDSAGNAQFAATIEGIKRKITSRLDAVTDEAMPTGDETATEIISDDSKSQARLIVWAQQAEDAFNQAIQFMGQFMGMGEDAAGTIELMPAWKIQKMKAEEAAEQKKVADEAAIEKTRAEAAAKSNG